MTTQNETADEIPWRFGETVPRLFDEKREQKAVSTFYDRMYRAYGEEGRCVIDYVVAGLKTLGDEFTAQIPYGREMMDRATHIKSFLEEKFDPALNNLVSVDEAGYAFRVMPEVELLFDDHDAVNSIVLVFYMVFAGPEDKLPDENVWKEILKRSFFAMDVQRLDSRLYVVNKGFYETGDLKQKRFELLSLLNDDDVSFLNEKEKKRLVERYHFDVSSHDAFLKSDIYDFEKWSNANERSQKDKVLSNDYSETFFFSFETANEGHPVLNPNGILGVHDRLKVDHRVGHPELLKWKEYGKERYMKRVLKECGIEAKDGESLDKIKKDPLDMLKECSTPDRVNKHFRKMDSKNPVFDSFNESNDIKNVMGDLCKERKTRANKGHDVGAMATKKQTALSSFFTKKASEHPKKKEEESTAQHEAKDDEDDDDLDVIRVRFLKETKDALMDEFKKPKDGGNNVWLPRLQELSRVSDYKGSKLLLSRNYVCDAFGSDLPKVVYDKGDDRRDKVNARRISLNALSSNVRCYRCVLNTNIWPFHYRSYQKVQTKCPIEESRVVKEIIRHGYARDYADYDLFQKEALRSDMQSVESDLKRARASDLSSPEMDRCLKKRQEITLFSYVNKDKYEKLGMELKAPDFFKPFLDVGKDDFDRLVSELVRSEIKKNKRFQNALSPTPLSLSSSSSPDKKRKTSPSDGKQKDAKRFKKNKR